VTNPFIDGMDDRLRGRYVRAVSNQGRVYRGWVERIHHHERHLMLRDATLVDEDDQKDVGSTLVTRATEVAVLEDDSRIERIALRTIEAAPYHEREFQESENRGYVADVRDTGFVGSFPVVRPIDGDLDHPGSEGFEVVEGHKRIWACRQAGIVTHPVEIVDISDWAAACRFVADHYPDPGQVDGDGAVGSGCYEADDLAASIGTLVDEWGERALELDRVRFNAERLELDVGGEGGDEDVQDDGEPAEDEGVPCPDCDRSFDDVRAMKNHRARTHEDRGLDVGEAKFWCGICQKGPLTDHGLKSHHGHMHEGQELDRVTNPPEEWTDDGTDDVPPHQDPEQLREAYEAADGVIADAAEELDVDVTTGAVRYQLVQHGIHDPDGGADGDEEDVDEDDALKEPDEGDSTTEADDAAAPDEEEVVREENDVDEGDTSSEGDEPDGADEEPEETFPRECHCGATLGDSLQLAIHRTEEHEVPQSTLDHLEPGEFEEIVEDADGVQDVVAEVSWSTERTLRMLGIYGLDDVVGAGDRELSDVTDVEFEGVDAGAGAGSESEGEADGQSRAADGGQALATNGGGQESATIDLEELGVTRDELVDAVANAQTVHQVRREMHHLSRDQVTDVLEVLGFHEELKTGGSKRDHDAVERAVREVTR
jgi:hypothetical protein